MADNTIRTIVIFGIITLVLVGSAVGGVLLMKARNDSYASARPQTVAQNNTPTNQPAPKKDDTKKDESQSNQQNQTPTDTPTPSSTAQPSSQPAPTSTTTSQGSGATPSGGMPATGPSDVAATVTMLMLAVFFAGKLIRARADYRRYVGL